jgi:hypothetical protein
MRHSRLAANAQMRALQQLLRLQTMKAALKPHYYETLGSE